MTYTTVTPRYARLARSTACTLARQLGENTGITAYQVLDKVLDEVETDMARGDKRSPWLLTLSNAL